MQQFLNIIKFSTKNHETWNNMAASYTKLGQKDKAHFVFQEAIKYDYENWKIWENYLWVIIQFKTKNSIFFYRLALIVDTLTKLLKHIIDYLI